MISWLYRIEINKQEIYIKPSWNEDNIKLDFKEECSGSVNYTEVAQDSVQ
jgi:hypothetical protein